MLRPGGVLIAETVNPHPIASFKAFWVDLTHTSPIFPEVAVVLCGLAGFGAARVMFPVGTGDLDRDLWAEGQYAVVATAVWRRPPASGDRHPRHPPGGPARAPAGGRRGAGALRARRPAVAGGGAADGRRDRRRGALPAVVRRHRPGGRPDPGGRRGGVAGVVGLAARTGGARGAPRLARRRGGRRDRRRRGAARPGARVPDRLPHHDRRDDRRRLELRERDRLAAAPPPGRRRGARHRPPAGRDLPRPGERRLRARASR